MFRSGGQMVSRRRFLQVGAVATGATLASQAVGQKTSDTGCGALPSSIAALKTMKDKAQPITNQERAARLDKAQHLMPSNELDAILLMEGTSLNYFTGIRWWGGERLFAMILPAKGKPFYVCPAFEEGRAREQISNGPEGNNADVRTWQEDENPYQLVAQGLKDRGLSTATLGMEETVRFSFSNGLAKASPQIKIVSATPVTAGCRMIKSTHELELMRLASQVTLAAFAAVYKSLKEGLTKEDLENLVDAAHQQLGFAGEADVMLGESSAFPHGSTAAREIHEGTVIMMDGGCHVEGYVSDITRTFVLGKPSDKMKNVFETVHQAQSAALAAARPGVPCGGVDGAARKVITDAGYGPDYKYFTHRVGHGMGMDGHEWPYLVRGNQTRLSPNMVFSDEPGIYIGGEFGVRLEDDMHITENGAELFTPQSPSAENPFGTA
jgi:Xaa-Pro aminopeptidase